MDGLCAVPVTGDKNFEKRRKKYFNRKYYWELNSDFALHPKIERICNRSVGSENTGSIV